MYPTSGRGATPRLQTRPSAAAPLDLAKRVYHLAVQRHLRELAFKLVSKGSAVLMRSFGHFAQRIDRPGFPMPLIACSVDMNLVTVVGRLQG